MRTWGRFLSLIGVGCSSLCFLALPLLVLIPGWLAQAMAAFFPFG